MNVTPKSKEWNPFTVDQWIAWLGATIIAAISMTVFFYNHFQTKEENQVYHENQSHYFDLMEKRLDRIESKVDQLLTSNRSQKE